MAMTSETSSESAYEAMPAGLLLRLYPRWSGTMTRKPAAASGAICLCQPYQNSGKPWRRTTTAPSFGPAATACNAVSLFWKASVSREFNLTADSTCPSGITSQSKKVSKARCAGSGGTHFRCVDAEAQPREVGLAERHEAGVEIAPDEEQQKRHRGVIFVDDRVDDGHGKIEPENNFRVGQPARFVPVGFFREGAPLAFDIEFWRARKFAFLSNDGFQDRLGIAHGNADAGGHDKGQIEKRSPPSLGAKLSLRDEIEAGDRARIIKESAQVDQQHLTLPRLH